MKKNKSHYDNLKQNGGEGSRAGEFNGSKGWPDNTRKKFDVNYQMTRRSSFCKINRQQMHSQMPLRKSLGINFVSWKFTNSLMSSSCVLVASFSFSMSSIMSSANSASFTSFPNWIPFYFSRLWLLQLVFLKSCWVKVETGDILEIFILIEARKRERDHITHVER